MSQISPPIRILLVAVIGLMAAWMLVLKPKDEPAPAAPAPATAPGATGLGNAVDQAEGAASAQEARDAKLQQATGEETGAGAAVEPAAKSAAAREAARVAAAKTAGLPRPIQRAIADRKVLVLLFWNPKSVDDRAVKRAVGRADRWSGDVFVRAANVKSVSRYGKITRGAAVEQSPSVVVVDRNLKAETLVGYVDTRSVDQAVVDAFRNSGVLIKNAYLREVNEVCLQGGGVSRTVVTPDQPAQVTPYLNQQRRVVRRTSTRFAALKAPARFRAFKRATVADHAAYSALLADWVAYLGPKPSAARVGSSLGRFGPREARLSKRYDRRMDAKHVLSCGSNA